MPNILYLISTPIGNLKDITLRALEVLKEVNLIAAEDTRKTSILLKHYDVKKPLISYRDQNHATASKAIIEKLKNRQSVALVSDSGTPCISDPGYKLVRDAVEQGIKVIPIPGSNAAIAALSASGLPTDKFTFLGFLPKSKGKRTKLLKEYGSKENSLVIYESPFRIKRLLEEINESLGNRDIAICNELTKMHEEIKRGTVKDLLNKPLKTKGEFTIIVGKEADR